MEAVTSGLNTEIFSAEREWTVEGLPVLTAQVSLPEPVGSENRTGLCAQPHMIASKAELSLQISIISSFSFSSYSIAF